MDNKKQVKFWNSLSPRMLVAFIVPQVLLFIIVVTFFILFENNRLSNEAKLEFQQLEKTVDGLLVLMRDNFSNRLQRLASDNQMIVPFKLNVDAQLKSYLEFQVKQNNLQSMALFLPNGKLALYSGSSPLDSGLSRINQNVEKTKVQVLFTHDKENEVVFAGICPIVSGNTVIGRMFVSKVLNLGEAFTDTILISNKKVQSKSLNVDYLLPVIEKMNITYEKGISSMLDGNISYSMSLIPGVQDERFFLIFGIDQTEAFQKTAYAIYLGILFGLFVVLILSIIGIYFTKTITEPLFSLVAIARKISLGDSSSSVLWPSNRKDELGVLNTALKTMTDKLQDTNSKLNSALRKATYDTDRIIASMNDMLFVLDSDGNILQINNSVRFQLGYTGDDLIGKHINHLAKNEVDDIFTIITPSLESKRTIITLKNNHDKEVIVQYSSSVLLDDAEKIAGFICVCNDISDKIAQEAESEKMQKQIFHASKLASIGELAAGVGHEINNPLAIIQGNMELFKNQIAKDVIDFEKIKKFLNSQSKAIIRIRNIVAGLRTYARTDTKNNEVIDVRNVVCDTLSLIENIYQNDEIFIDKILDAKLCCVIGNVGKFQQVLMNLFSNARDALKEEKEKEKSITIKTKNNTKGKLVLEVIDSGTGIDSTSLDKIFEPFYSTKERGEGTGLGLGITYEIVKEMKGVIEVDSEFGVGTKFSIILPLSDKQLHLDIVAEEKKIECEKLSGKVLIVDDENEIREVLKGNLESYGLNVDEAFDGQDGLEKIGENKYDLVITDLKMPRLTGEELITKAKMEYNLEDTRFIIITGGVTTEYSKEKRNSLWKLADGYLRKPFLEQEIYNLIVKVLSNA